MKHKITNQKLELIRKFGSVGRFYILDKNKKRIIEKTSITGTILNYIKYETCVCSMDNVFSDCI